MRRRPRRAVLLVPTALLLGATGSGVRAQMPMPGMTMPQTEPAPPAPADASKAASPDAAKPATMAGMPGMAMPNAAAGMDMSMEGMLGRYAMTRESSGTSWQPDSSPMRAAMVKAGGWSVMAEGYATLVYDNQGGPRGDTKTFSNSMGMLMASRDVSPVDRIGLRTMLSLDPAMGPSGYPLLFATGETANGRTPLIDRQHPHDLFMELAGSWSHDLGDGKAVSLYAGLPGEPALGPPTFMHRVSAMDDPEAPIGHHWFDSTHITYGVVTAGFSSGLWKIEASAFKGREPDQHRWNIEAPKLDSWSVRGTWNPIANVSLQLSTGHLHSPEQLEPNVDEQRTTASVIWNLPLGGDRNLATTLAWSRKAEHPGPTLTGLLAETALRLGRNEIFARAEHEQENELFDDGPFVGRIFGVAKASLGYQHEVPVATHMFVAIGGLASAYAYPDVLRASYGHAGVKSFMLYGRLRFGA
jgi:hypothetical protein